MTESIHHTGKTTVTASMRWFSFWITRWNRLCSVRYQIALETFHIQESPETKFPFFVQKELSAVFLFQFAVEKPNSCSGSRLVKQILLLDSRLVSDTPEVSWISVGRSTGLQQNNSPYQKWVKRWDFRKPYNRFGEISNMVLASYGDGYHQKHESWSIKYTQPNNEIQTVWASPQNLKSTRNPDGYKR